MTRLFLSALAAALISAAPAQAAERTYAVGSFDHVRVDGPFEVHVDTGGSPGARASGSAELLDRLDITVNDTTLIVRLGNGGWGETPKRAGAAPPVVTLSTPRLTAIAASAGARVSVAKMAAQRIDLSLVGAGTLAVDGAAADEIRASQFGTGSMRLAGRAARVRLSGTGAGSIDAGALIASDLVVRLDGNGDIRANALHTAQVTSTALGQVTVVGAAKCTIRATADGPVRCGGQ